MASEHYSQRKPTKRPATSYAAAFNLSFSAWNTLQHRFKQNTNENIVMFSDVRTLTSSS